MCENKHECPCVKVDCKTTENAVIALLLTMPQAHLHTA